MDAAADITTVKQTIAATPPTDTKTLIDLHERLAALLDRVENKVAAAERAALRK